MFEKIIVCYKFVGLLKMVQKCPNGPKVTFLLIETYLSVYLRPERSPAVRRCAYFINIQNRRNSKYQIGNSKIKKITAKLVGNILTISCKKRVR